MDEKTQNLVTAIRSLMQAMTDEQRLEIIAAVESGYCNSCGAKMTHVQCAACNDE